MYINEEKEKNEGKEKNRFTINGLTVYRVCIYFILYCIIGYIIEMSFSVISTGRLESRQSFLYGPFCGIYGFGATMMIVSLHKLSKQKWKLFISGFLLGSIIEYTMSYLAEVILGVQWWNYYNRPFNINGRICLLYSIFWGVLAVLSNFNPYIDNLINKMKIKKVSIKILRITIIGVTILIIIDFILSMFAVTIFQARMIIRHDIPVKNRDKVELFYDFIYENNTLRWLTETFWNDRKMIRTYPNLKIEDKDKNIIYLDSLLPEIQTYYYKFGK